MNLILIEAAERAPDGAVTLGGRRAEHILGILKAEVGQTLRVGILDGPVGEGVVTALGPGEVQLRVALQGAPEPFPGRVLILAMQRPPTLRKILQQGATLGVSALHLIRARRVEKSYFQSPLLAPEALRAELILGLEQARDTRVPEVHIHPHFRPFAEEILPGILAAVDLGLVAHPEGAPSILAHAGALAGGASCALAIGPEGGWVDFEVDALKAAGCQPVSMGGRILRSETAAVAALAQIGMLQGEGQGVLGPES